MTQELVKDCNSKGDVIDLIKFHEKQSLWDLMVLLDLC